MDESRLVKTLDDAVELARKGKKILLVAPSDDKAHRWFEAVKTMTQFDLGGVMCVANRQKRVASWVNGGSISILPYLGADTDWTPYKGTEWHIGNERAHYSPLAPFIRLGFTVIEV